MKFTIDTENNKILFHEPFTIEDLQHVLSLINIDGVEEWKVDISDDYLSDRPTDTITNPLLPPTDNTGWWQNPYVITSTNTGTINFTNNDSTTELETIYN